MHPFIRSLTLLLLSLTGSILHAQHAFQTILPGVSPALKRPIVQTPDGGFCILAQASHDETATGSEPLFTDPHLVLIKTNAEGSIEWSRSIATRVNKSAHPVALRAMPDGGFLIVANTVPRDIPSCGMDKPPDPRQDVTLLRFNAHGYPVWSRTYTWEDVAWAADAIVLDDGSAIITGAIEKVDTVNTEILKEGFITSRWKGLAFRVDHEGEVKWGRTLLDFPERSTFERVVDSFGEAIIARKDVMTIAFQLQHDIGNQSSLLLNVDRDGKTWGDGEWLRTWREGLDGGEFDNGIHYSTFVNDLTPLYNGGYAVAGVMGSGINLDCTGFLAAYDAQNNRMWNRSYFRQENYTDPITFSVIPLGETGFLLAGRTLQVPDYDGVNGYDSDLDDPTIALTDATGTLIDARRLVTSFEDILPIPEDSFGPAGSYLRHPLFSPTDDQGFIAIGAVENKLEPYRRTLFLARLNPDLTICGENSTESIPLNSASKVTKVDPASYTIDWNVEPPLDASPTNHDVQVMWMPESPTYGSEDGVETSTLSVVDEIGVPEETEEETVSRSDSYSDTDGWRVGPPPEEWLSPIISAVEISLEEIEIESEELRAVDVQDFELSPTFICGDVPMIEASSAPSIEESVEAEYLHVLPNSIQKGKSVVVEVRFRSNEKPEVNLVSVGLGEVVRHVDAKRITWSSADGNGGARIETADLPAGVYLVQVRSGEKQLTAKLELR